jgi:hypothetical protein
VLELPVKGALFVDWCCRGRGACQAGDRCGRVPDHGGCRVYGAQARGSAGDSADGYGDHGGRGSVDGGCGSGHGGVEYDCFPGLGIVLIEVHGFAGAAQRLLSDYGLIQALSTYSMPFRNF